jgi:hypothetical protein
MLKGDGRGTRLIFDKSFLSSSSVLVNPFCIPCQGHLVTTVECRKTCVDVCPTFRAMCFACVLCLCALPGPIVLADVLFLS